MEAKRKSRNFSRSPVKISLRLGAKKSKNRRIIDVTDVTPTCNVALHLMLLPCHIVNRSWYNIVTHQKNSGKQWKSPS